MERQGGRKHQLETIKIIILKHDKITRIYSHRFILVTRVDGSSNLLLHETENQLRVNPRLLNVGTV